MRKSLLFSLSVLFFILSISLSVFAAEVDDKSEPVSLGLCVLAERGKMAKSALVGNKIGFVADDFARAMNLAKVTSITLTELPPLTDGELLVGSVRLSEGQTVSGANISLMSYVPRSNSPSSSSFRFSVGESAYDVECQLYMLDAPNASPSLPTPSELSLNVSTHKNITLYGSLSSYDPDGDATSIEIVSYPKNGILIVGEGENPEYTYTPSANYTGEDSFRYVARDKYGNYSASKTVNLTVKAPRSSLVYEDMLDSSAYTAALTVSEEGIMSGMQLAGKSYFQPDKTVSRCEFLVMAMNSIGITDVADVTATEFSDDSDIPSSMKGYVSTAYELGYIDGTYIGSKLCFLPNKEITRAEAAIIVCNMIDAATPTSPPVFADEHQIPVYARSAVYSLNYMGILSSKDGNISADSPLTRADAAKILAAVMTIKN